MLCVSMFVMDVSEKVDLTELRCYPAKEDSAMFRSGWKERR